MSDGRPEADAGSGAMMPAVIACVFMVIFYVISPGICIRIWDHVPGWILPLYMPLEYLYMNFGPYEYLIDCIAGN